MIIDFKRININKREQMMGGDRINDVALNTLICKVNERKGDERIESDHQSVW